MVSASGVSRDHYYLLSSEIEDERIQAAINLIKELQAADDDKEWDYSFNRLIKGLSSLRAAARIGFSTALSEILNIRFKDGKINTSIFLNVLDEQSKAARSTKKGKDERAYLFGRLFGLKAVANSNIIIESDKELFDESFAEFTSQLLDLSLLKSWIRESCFYTLYEFLVKVSSHRKLSDHQLTTLLTEINDKQLTLSTEGLSIYLLLILQNKSVVFKQLQFSNGWKENNPLVKSNLHILAKTLKNVDASNSSENENTQENGKAQLNKDTKKKGSWSPNLHYVWNLIIQTIITVNLENETIETPETEGSKKRKSLSKSSKHSKKQKITAQYATDCSADLIKVNEFWKVVVDDSLFSMKASPERKYWGFKVFQLFVSQIARLATVNDQAIPLLDSIFTENFLRTMINQSGQSSRLLNGLVKKEILNGFIGKSVASNPSNAKVSIELLHNFSFSPFSNLNFDIITGTKTVDSLINNVATFGDFEQLSNLASSFLEVLENPLNYVNHIEEKQLKESKKNEDDDEEDQNDDGSLNKTFFQDKLIEKKQKWAVNQLSVLLKYYRVRLNTLQNNFVDNKEKIVGKEINNEWIDEIIKKFVTLGYFKMINDTKNETVSAAVSKMISTKLSTLLLDILSFKRVDNNSWLYIALKQAFSMEDEQNKLKSHKKKYVSAVSLDDDLNKLKVKNFKVLTKIIMKKSQLIQTNFSAQNSKTQTLIKKLSSFELIYSIILLQFFSDAESLQDSISILDEVNAAYKKFHLNQEINDDNGTGEADLSSDDEKDAHQSDNGFEDSDSDSRKFTNASTSDEDAADFRSIDILLEIVLGFIHQKSALSKKLSLIVWETFVSDLQYKNLQNLYDILLVKENVEGQKSLFDVGDETNEDGAGEANNDEEEEEEEEDEMDVEEEEESEIDDDDEPDADAKDFLDKLDKKTTLELAKALQIPEDDVNALKESVKKGNEISDDDSSSSDSDSDSSTNSGEEQDNDLDSDEESMDDEQMMAIDSQLSMIFKQRQNALQNVKTGNKRKEEKIEAQENMKFFKTRILDLLEIYVDKVLDKSNSAKGNESGMGSLNEQKYLSLSLIRPLLSLMELTLNVPLREKAYKLLKKVAKVKVVLKDEFLMDGEHVNESSFHLSEETLLQDIQFIHEKSVKAANPALSGAYNQLSLYLSKILIQYNPAKNYNKVIDIYSTTLKNWVNHKNSKVNASLFYDLVNYFASVKQK